MGRVEYFYLHKKNVYFNPYRMFRIFGSSPHPHDSHESHAKWHKTKTSHDHAHEEYEEHGHGEHLEVRTHDDDYAEEEHGQVALDILDLNEAIVVVAPLAGVPTEGIQVSISRNILSISGERLKPDVYQDANAILVEECFYGSFSRSIILPENLALNKMRATIENNLLIVEIPRLQFPSKTIKIDRLEK